MEHMAPETELTDREMNEMLDRVKTADAFAASPDAGSGAPEDEQVLCDEYGFPFEPEGMYNNAPLEFEETAKALWVVICNLNYAAARYNRLSPYFPMLMSRLEKNIRHMGSYCITKTVLEQSGEQFPGLEQINILELYKMVSVMFRKCCGAYNDLQTNKNTQDMNMIGWLFRWAALAERLKATQERIGKIENGEIKIEQLLKRETVYRDEPKRQRDDSCRKVGPRVRASSLPVLKSFTREVKAHKRALEKHERAVQREAERARRRYERELERMTDVYKEAPVYRPTPFPKIPGLGISELELKRLLIDEAKSRRDMTEVSVIAREGLEPMMERFKKLQQDRGISVGSDPGGSQQLSQRDPRSGPSAETRKKLREKRKKRK